MLVVGDAVGKSVRIYVCEPEDKGGDRHERGDVSGLTRVRPGRCHEDGKDEDCAIDEAAQPGARWNAEAARHAGE